MKLTLVLPIHRFALLTVKLVSVISIAEIRIGNANFRGFRAVIFFKANAKHSRMPIKMRWFLFVVFSCVSLEVRPVEIVFSLFLLASLISLKLLFSNRLLEIFCIALIFLIQSSLSSTHCLSYVLSCDNWIVFIPCSVSISTFSPLVK